MNLLQAIFAIDWFNTTNDEACFDPRYCFGIEESARVAGELPLQLPTSGYDTPWPALLHLYFGMITLAQKNITIVSP